MGRRRSFAFIVFPAVCYGTSDSHPAQRLQVAVAGPSEGQHRGRAILLAMLTMGPRAHTKEP